DPALWKDNEINIAWIGHSTVLINFFGTLILTDPVFYERIGVSIFGMTFGPSRFTHPALTIDEIPKPDIILLSHAHMDHMDYDSLNTLSSRYPDEIDCITAYNTADVIAELKWKSLQEIDWNEETELQGIKFKANEVKHFGWRYPWEKDRSNGYMQDGRSYNAVIIEKSGKKILFGGDTAYHELFKPLKEENIDIVIMPIGAYNPWKRNHCNPEEALIMADEHIGAKYFIPIHTKTFKQGMEPIDEPLAWLNDSVSNYKIKLAIDDIGKTFTLNSF
ncbi:MAG: MBL fold metallo-hydrolase, partial [Ignavibacteriaceae bacterium]|nr:MBL fold metallo-hydrolase [Ignavibacteriaceae bacterium]